MDLTKKQVQWMIRDAYRDNQQKKIVLLVLVAEQPQLWKGLPEDEVLAALESASERAEAAAASYLALLVDVAKSVSRLEDALLPGSTSGDTRVERVNALAQNAQRSHGALMTMVEGPSAWCTGLPAEAAVASKLALLVDVAKRLSRLEAALLPGSNPGDTRVERGNALMQNAQLSHDALMTMVEGPSASRTAIPSGWEEGVEARQPPALWSWLPNQWAALRSGLPWGSYKKTL